MMVSQPHTPEDLPDPVSAIIDQVREWKQGITKTLGPGLSLRPEISMFDADVNFLGDVEFPHPFSEYDCMGIGLGLCGMVMAFDVRYFCFYTEAFLVTSDMPAVKREDGSLEAPGLDEVHRRLHHPSNYESPQEAWLAGDESVQPSLLVIVADTLMGRTWSTTLPYKHDLGNTIRWLDPQVGANQGPDYRSLMYGVLLLPSIIRSQYDYLRMRPEPKDAVEYLFSQGCTMSLAEGTIIHDRLTESGIHLVSHDDIEAIVQEREDFIAREVGDIPDALPDEWMTGE